MLRCVSRNRGTTSGPPLTASTKRLSCVVSLVAGPSPTTSDTTSFAVHCGRPWSVARMLFHLGMMCWLASRLSTTPPAILECLPLRFTFTTLLRRIARPLVLLPVTARFTMPPEPLGTSLPWPAREGGRIPSPVLVTQSGPKTEVLNRVLLTTTMGREGSQLQKTRSSPA